MVAQNSSSSISLHPIYSSMNNMNNSFLATHISNNYPRRMMLARDNINNAFNNNRGMNIRNNQFFNPMNTNNYNTTSEVAVAAVRRNKSPSRIKTSPYKDTPQSLGNNPIPINTDAMNYNKNFINNNISKQNL